MFAPVVIVESGGAPFTQVAEGVGAPAFTVVESGAFAITLVESGAAPIALFNPDGSRWGTSYDPDAQALFARFTTPPTVQRKAVINDLIIALKAAGAWSKLDVLYVRAAADSQAARLNWIADQYNSTAFSSPVFTVDRGFTPDGSASYLASGFDPTTAVSPKLTQNDAHLGGWHLTDLPNGASASADLGNANSRIFNAANTTSTVRANNGSNINIGSDDYTKHKVWARDGANTWRYYNDGALVGGDPRTDASVALTAFDMGTGRTAANNFGLNQEAVSHWGSYLSPAQVLAMRNAFATYLSAVGAI